MRQVPNVISALRILGGAALLFCVPEGLLFWVIYAFCGLSDMVDGFLARKLGAESKAGAVLDSVADMVFVLCCAVKLLPALSVPLWLWIWAGAIAAVKLINQILALHTLGRFCFPHTGANKLTGFLLFVTVPSMLLSMVPVAVVAAVATFAAIEEGLAIRTGTYL